MSDEILEAYIRQYIEAQKLSQATIAWQGGEPTLMGLDFYRRSIRYVERYRRPGMTIQYTIQTNGILLDNEWCRFFRQNSFLVGLSLDGPRAMHDAFRVDKSGGPTFDKVMRAVRLLKKHRVDFNILTTVHVANANYPVEVYRFLRDDAGANFIQFIPIVEQDNETGFQEGNDVTDRSVKPAQFGRFLISVFDEWVKRDVGKVFVQLFDVALAAWSGLPADICTFSPTCGTALAMEHNGDLYSCDHFVEPRYYLGNIKEKHMAQLVASKKQLKFGRAKLDGLPEHCLKCDVLFVCHGECPKNRFIETPDGEQGLSYLCEGYKAFFTHINGPMRFMAHELKCGRAPANIMNIAATKQGQIIKVIAQPGRNDPCPCGSGLKFKKCHGDTKNKKKRSPEKNGATWHEKLSRLF